MKIRFVETENMKRLRGLAKSLVEADQGQPRMGMVQGAAGLGKTTAVDHLAVETGAAYVRAIRGWTPHSMLRDICEALGASPGWGVAACLRVAVDALQERQDSPSQGNGLLIIDEADYLAVGVQPPATPKLLDTVRDLHDLSGAPILLVGMDRLGRTLSAFPQSWDRMLEVLEFRPVGWREAASLARELGGMALDEETARELARATGGNLRQMVVYLVRLDRLARVNKVAPNTRRVQETEAWYTQRRMRAAGKRRAA